MVSFSEVRSFSFGNLVLLLFRCKLREFNLGCGQFWLGEGEEEQEAEIL